MNRTRYLAASAAHALSQGVPLGPALEGALPAPRPAAETKAIARAHAGDLRGALAFAGVDPLVAAAAKLDAGATFEAHARTSALPSARDVRWLILAPLNYLAALLPLQALTLVLLHLFVMPTLYMLAAKSTAEPGPALLEPVWLLAFVLVALGFGVAVRFILLRLRVRLAQARVSAVAALLIGRGAAPAVVADLSRAAELPPLALAGLVSGPVDAAGLAQQADAFATEAMARAARAAEGLRIAVGIWGAVLALLILAPLYLRIAQLGEAVVRIP